MSRPGVDDPFAVLGLATTASLDEVRSARRRLAQALHPDHAGGDADAMRRVNEAFDLAVRAIRARRGNPPDAPPPPAPPTSPDATPAPSSRPTATGGRRARLRHVERDSPSFTIDLLPAEAFEALAVVATWLGEVLVDDPPYLLEVQLDDPAPCWCHLDLMPEAGGSTVSVSVAGVEGGPWPPPSAEQVRDTWIAALNQLGRDGP